MKRRMRRLLLGLTVAGVAAGVLAPVASAHYGNATITCTGVTFNYTQFFTPDAYNTVQQYITIDNGTPAESTFTFYGFGGEPGDSDTVPITLSPGTHTITADAYNGVNGEVVGFPVTQTVSCGPPPPPPCQPGTSANFRWHYNANGSSGSWSGTKTQQCNTSFSMGPQDMEGDQKLAPGTTMNVGYDFTVPGNNASLVFTVSNAQVVFTMTCVSGATPTSSTFVVTMPTQTYTVTNSQWYPSGDQSSPLVYQGSATVPDVCNGGLVRFQKGGTFSATLS